jgi:hypothetical protein
MSFFVDSIVLLCDADGGQNKECFFRPYAAFRFACIANGFHLLVQVF